MNYIEKWKAERERKSFLALDDGTVFHGVAFGAPKDALGEVVFNTGMTGYQEILTDPSYAGQFVVLTTAEVGNYGVNAEDVESRGLFLSGLLIGDLTLPSNWRSEKSLDDYLRENGVPGLYGVDTRALALHIREHGNRKAYLCTMHNAQCTMHNAEDAMQNAEGTMHNAQCTMQNVDAAIAKAKGWEGLDGQDYAAKVTCEKPYVFLNTKNTENTKLTGNLCELCELCGKNAPHIVCYDFGVKTNILRALSAWADVIVVPAKTPAEEVLALNPDGVFLSNGPADPAAVTYAIENIQKLLGLRPMAMHNAQCTMHNGKRMQDQGLQSLVTRHSSLVTPVMGICLGHQLLALACGAKTGRLKFGHHGCNHPVKNLATGKVEITSQNHNFAVLPESVPDCLEVTHVNLNDGSIEGIRHKTLPAFSVQYHPEACPGPHDSHYLFSKFQKLCNSFQTQSGK
jgi:carbamoyl-phosphate synthase small subunit